MQLKMLFALLAVAAAITFGSAITHADETLNYADYSLTLVNDRGQRLDDKLVHIELKSLSSDRIYKHDKYASIGTIDIRVPKDEYKLVVLARDVNSNFFSFYAEKQVNLLLGQGNESVLVMPIAYIRGMIYDKDENLIADASVKYDCPSANIFGQFTADEFGTFVIKFLPLGQCRIYAASENYIGFAQIDLTESKVYDVRIDLLQKNSSSRSAMFVISSITILVILIASGLVYFVTREPAPRQSYVQDSSTEAKPVAKNQSTERMDTIIRTLNEYEREIVQLLLKNNNAMTQNKIRHESGIPKTSLFRCIQRLEQRNILSTKTSGKVKKVELTGFFLSGNETKAK